MSMKHLISRTRKAACTLAAAALALSCWPLSAFAADQISMDAPLAASTGATQTQATYAARDGQLSVTAPVSMTLAASDGTPLDVRHPESWPPLTQNLSFQNNSATKLYLSSATVSPAAGAKAIFTDGNLDLALTGTGTSTATAAMPVASTAATGFTMPSDMKTAFALAGSGTATFKLAATLPTANLKSAETLAAAGSLAGATSQLASLSWTFTVAQGFSGDGDTGANFYLKVSEKATDKNLVDMRGEVFSLKNVVEMADDLAKYKEDSDYYPMFNAMLGAASEQYECKVKWNNIESPAGGTAYDVRVIGINHDDLATSVDGRTKAGLTFQFKNLLGRTANVSGSESWGFVMNSASTSLNGWGRCMLRANMNPGTDIPQAGTDTNAIWDMVPSDQQSAFKTVIKPYGYFTSGIPKGAGTQGYSNDKLFIASYFELGGGFGNTGLGSDYQFLTKEGTQYAYWRNAGATGNNNDQTMLVKGYQASPEVGTYWWERSMTPNDNNTFCFMIVRSMGNPVSSRYDPAAASTFGVCPCFCL